MGEAISKKDGLPSMKVDNSIKKKVNYIIIKIGNKIYSTKFGEKEHEKGCFCTLNKTETKGIGKERSLMIRNGKFVETNKHEKIDPINFEVDIYFQEDEDGSK